MHDSRWVVIVNCKDYAQTNSVWSSLKLGGYNLLGQWHLWVIVGESQGVS